jgi:hypothetical protein
MKASKTLLFAALALIFGPPSFAGTISVPRKRGPAVLTPGSPGWQQRPQLPMLVGGLPVTAALTGSGSPVAVPAAEVQPTALGGLQATVGELAQPEARAEVTLERFFSKAAAGSSVGSELGSPDAGSTGRFSSSLWRPNSKKTALMRRVRSYRGRVDADANDELVPYVEQLWQAKLLTTDLLSKWSKTSLVAALRAAKSEESFTVIAGYLKLEEWDVASFTRPESLELAWKVGGGREKIRFALAIHPKTPPSILRVLAADADPDLRAYVAHNVSLSDDLLETLNRDEAMTNYGHPVSAYSHSPTKDLREGFDKAFAAKDMKEMEVYANYPRTPRDILRKLAVWFPEQLAGNPGAGADTLRQLSKDHAGEGVLKALAGNPATPPDVLEKLARSEHAGVRETVSKNQSLPRDAFGRLLSEFPSPELDEAGLNALLAECATANDYNRILLRQPLKNLGVAVPLQPGGENLSLGETKSALATLAAERRSLGLPPFRNIVIDVRNSRGGRGDVAAGYLTAIDLLERAKGKTDEGPGLKVTLLIDDSARKILSGMRGKPLEAGDVDFEGSLTYRTLTELPQDQAADMYLGVASPSGSFKYSPDFLRLDRNRSALRRLLRRFENWLRRTVEDEPELVGLGVPINEDTVLMVQTVLGNTENQNSWNPYALVKVGQRELKMLPAGLAARETGVYSDNVAWKLRNMGRPELKDFLLQAAESITDDNDRINLRTVLRETRLKGAEIGLVYGISMKAVKPQFESYLAGLAAKAKASSSSYVLVTPSGFKLEDVADEQLRDRLVVIGGEGGGWLNKRNAEPGKIYILRTQALPHPVFVGLMAYSRPPPVMAGDGAMSAAIVLGRPFVMTRVEWNKRNIANFKERMQEGLISMNQIDLLEDVYGEELNLKRALELEELADRYAGLVDRLPGFTSGVMAAAVAAKNVLNRSVPLESVLPYWSQAQKAEILLERSRMGDKEAKKLFPQAYWQLSAAERLFLGKRIVETAALIRLRKFFLNLAFLVQGLYGRQPAAASPPEYH